MKRVTEVTMLVIAIALCAQNAMAMYGDYDASGRVNWKDLQSLASVWLASNCTLTSGIDNNSDCQVNLTEYSSFAGNWQACTTASAPQDLMVPPLAFDDSSMTIIWSKPADYSNITGYSVYRDGTFLGTTTKLFYNVTGLAAGTQYSFITRAINMCGAESGDSNVLVKSTMSAMPVLNVTSYGAVGNGTTLNTIAIQNAINACTPGGKVLIPAGTFVSGAIFLKSNMTLQIEGTLRGSDTAADYPFTCLKFPYYTSGTNYMGLINAYTTDYNSISNVRICGSGTVNGASDVVGSIINHGITKLAVNQVAARGGVDAVRGDMVTIKGVNGLYIGDLTFVNPADHTMMITYCRDVCINGITVSTYDIHNADGSGVCTSDTAYIFDSTFDTGDDCIGFNAGIGADGVAENRPATNIRVFNCTTHRGHGGVVFGSWTAAWIQNVLIEDCTFDGTDRGLRLKSGNFQGGGARNVLARDLTIKNIAVDAAIFVDSSYGTPTYPSAGPGQFRDITFRNINCIASKKYGIYVNGQAGTPHTNLIFDHIYVSGSPGAYLNYLTDSSFNSVSMTGTTQYWNINSSTTSGLSFTDCSPMP
jgi:exo-poly-alpha-galacturonosidase